MRGTRVVTLYEPRWHGFARWTHEAWHGLESALPDNVRVTLLEKGWIKRRRGARYMRCMEPWNEYEQEPWD